MAYLPDNNTRTTLSAAVWIMTSCGSAANVCHVSATRGKRSSRYAMQSDIAAVRDGRPEAGVLATYPSFFNNLRNALGNGARLVFAVMRDQFLGPETGAPVYHWSCGTDRTGRSRCARGVGFVSRSGISSLSSTPMSSNTPACLHNLPEKSAIATPAGFTGSVCLEGLHITTMLRPCQHKTDLTTAVLDCLHNRARTKDIEAWCFAADGMHAEAA